MYLMLFVSTLLLAQTPAAPAQPAPAAPPAATTQPAEPPQPAVVYNSGPMRMEIVAMREIRLTYNDDPNRSVSESNFAMQVRIAGDKLDKIARFGNLILTEAVDDQGTQLVKPDTYTEQDKTQLRQQMMPADRLQQTGLLIATRAGLSARGAKTLRALKGSIKLIISQSTEKLTLLNPSQYVGKSLDDGRLAEYEIAVRVVGAEELDQELQPQRCIVLEISKNAEKLQGVAFHDGTMAPIRHRENAVTLKNGNSATMYCLDGGAFTNETSLVLEVHPNVEVIDLPLDMKDVALP